MEIGGTKILIQKNKNGHNALSICLECSEYVFGDTFIFMAKKYISAQIGGEFGIGGLFNSIPI